jgi:outer membrane protein assembly factor BamD
MRVEREHFVDSSWKGRCWRRAAAPLLAVFSAVFLWGCSTSADVAAKLTRELLSMPKEEAYARGEALVAKRKYDEGRQYLRFVAENYASDPIGKQAALRLADSYFDEKTPLGYMEAQTRYKDFRNRYPSHPKADYALFRLAQTSDRQAENPDRDQTNTRLALTSYRDFLQSFPDSPWAAEARSRYLVMRNLMAEHEFRVANFYLHRKAYLAAKGRYDGIMAAFPDYRNIDRVLYEAGFAERKMGHADEATVLWSRLRTDFPESSWLKKVPPTKPVPAAVVSGSGSASR